MSSKKHLLHSLHHLIAGMLLVIKGVDKISHHHPVIGGLVLLFGLLILAFFVYTQLKKRLADRLELMVRWFEALVAVFTAYVLFTEGKKWLPYLSLLAALGFFFSIYMFHKKQKKELS